MNSRERILAAVGHREADRVPIDFGGSMVTSIHKRGLDNLKAYLNINADKETEIARGRSLVAKVDTEVQDALGVDARMLIVNSPDGWIESSEQVKSGRQFDEWGMEWEIRPGIDNYDIISTPLGGPDVSLETVKSMRWPDPTDLSFLKGFRERAESLRKNSPDKAIIANLAMQIHTQSYFLRGFEDYLMDMVRNPQLIEAILDRVTEIFVARSKAIMSEIGEFVDIVYLADDLGMQTGPLFSPNIYRKMLKPRHQKLFEAVKSSADVKILYHTCGSVLNFVDDLAEIGVDILNPVQVSAQDMDTKVLKKRFGDKVCFWGSIDTHRVLPFGTVDEVKDEVKRRIEDLAPGGGFVLASVHNIRPEVPPENIIAMIETAKEFGIY